MAGSTAIQSAPGLAVQSLVAVIWIVWLSLSFPKSNDDAESSIEGAPIGSSFFSPQLCANSIEANANEPKNNVLSLILLLFMIITLAYILQR